MKTLRVYALLSFLSLSTSTLAADFLSDAEVIDLVNKVDAVPYPLTQADFTREVDGSLRQRELPTSGRFGQTGFVKSYDLRERSKSGDKCMLMVFGKFIASGSKQKKETMIVGAEVWIANYTTSDALLSIPHVLKPSTYIVTRFEELVGKDATRATLDASPMAAP